MTPTTSTSTGNDTSSPTFTWVINDFPKSNTEKLFSDVFIAAGYKWQLVAYPKGSNVHNGFSVYLLPPSGSAKLPSGWSVDVEFSFTMVNQFLRKESITRRTNYQFREGDTDWGYAYFMPLTKLHDPTEGYIVNDTVIIETDLSARDSSSRDSNKEIEAKMMPLVRTEPKKKIPTLPLATRSALLQKSKNLLTELSILKITRESTSASTSGISSESSLLPISPKTLKQQRNALKYYVALSLEAIDHQANGFDDIEKITLLLLQYPTSSLERTILTNLVSRLAGFKEIVPSTKSSIENMRAEKVSFSGKKADVRARLYQGKEQLISLEVEFSNLLEEERELEAQIMRLTTMKEVLLIKKKLVAIELEKIKEQVGKDVLESRDITEEDEHATNNWIQTREKLAEANISWELFRRNLEQCEKSL